MIIKTIGYIAGSLQLIATVVSQISAFQGGWWTYMNLMWLASGLSLGIFIILLSTKLKI
tara:strand:+ start:133 stop:309 length:177 start_codon:yes stop_codon:yes gene_type:complete